MSNFHSFRKPFKLIHHPAAAVIGGGPAGLMAAEVLAGEGVAVTLYDQMPSVGRKLLLAGRGGLNLTHAEAMPVFLSRYGAARSWLEPIIAAFPPEALIGWCNGLGQPTFIGSSARDFPHVDESLAVAARLVAAISRPGRADSDTASLDRLERGRRPGLRSAGSGGARSSVRDHPRTGRSVVAASWLRRRVGLPFAGFACPLPACQLRVRR